MKFKERLEAFIERERLMPLQQETKIKLLGLINEVDALLANTKGMDRLRQARQELEEQ